MARQREPGTLPNNASRGCYDDIAPRLLRGGGNMLGPRVTSHGPAHVGADTRPIRYTWMTVGIAVHGLVPRIASSKGTH